MLQPTPPVPDLRLSLMTLNEEISENGEDGEKLTTPKLRVDFLVCMVSASTIMSFCIVRIVLFDIFALLSGRVLAENLWLGAAHSACFVFNPAATRGVFFCIGSRFRPFRWPSTASLAFRRWWRAWMLFLSGRVGTLFLRGFPLWISPSSAVGLVCKPILLIW